MARQLCITLKTYSIVKRKIDYKNSPQIVRYEKQCP